MADHDHQAFVFLQPVLQPDQCVQVQVVGRLIEQHQVCRAHQRPGQLQPHAPSAREAVDRCVELVGAKPQAQQQRLGACRRVESASVLQPDIGVADRMAILRQLGCCQHGLGLGQRQVAVEHIVGGRLVGLGHFLRDLADAPFAGHVEVAGVSLQPAGDQREQRGLAGAIAADQSDFLAGVQRHAGVFEDDLDASAQGQVLYLDHGVGFGWRVG